MDVRTRSRGPTILTLRGERASGDSQTRDTPMATVGVGIPQEPIPATTPQVATTTFPGRSTHTRDQIVRPRSQALHLQITQTRSHPEVELARVSQESSMCHGWTRVAPCAPRSRRAVTIPTVDVLSDMSQSDQPIYSTSCPSTRKDQCSDSQVFSRL